ncbi:hypothetical protein DL95DRAFT_501919 [Leptodontidium sp. 2 PMI_412]|nr:hypothetical protein DL95DRAFT_501919 [Leptodontidium sp. 2 PMI_412]
MDVLLALPRDTYHVRQLLFALPMPFSLNAANQAQFWPLIDSVYSIRKEYDVGVRKLDSRPAHKRCDVICRFKRARAAPSASQGKRASSSKRIISGCSVSFTLLAFPDHYEYQPTSQSRNSDQITCIQHSHSLDESDANKRNSFLRKLVGAEVANGYPPAAVIGSLIGNGRADARARLASAGGTYERGWTVGLVHPGRTRPTVNPLSYLTRQDVINAGLTWRLANPNRLWAVASAKNNVSLQGVEAIETLAGLGWLVSQVSATSLDHVDGRGLSFADPARLSTLEAHGHLSLIDSTHKTNQLEWKLFTLMVRDQYACWHPVAHGLLSHEFGELIAELLLVVKQWCNWQLRYVLSDDSAAEQRAFRLAFPGLVRGETERKLGTSADAKSRGHVMAALCNRRTEPGARDSVAKAIKTAAGLEKAKYIRDNWLKSLPLWANYSPYRAAEWTRPTFHPLPYSLSGIISLIAQCDSQYISRAKKAAYDWSKKKLSATLEHPWLDAFPYHVQLLLLGEIKGAEVLAESGDESGLPASGKCDCRFARSYWLPCKHVIYAWEVLAEIEEPDWADLAEQFDESGFEIYTSKGLIKVIEEDDKTSSRDITAKLATNETLESIRARFFEVVEVSDSLDEEARDRLLRRWEAELANFSSAFIGRSLEEWLQRDDEVILF